jgi:O-antigen/teichoic acid export membrane protein
MVAQMQGLLQICSGVIGLTLGTAMVRLGSEYGIGERFSVLAGTGLRVALYSGLSMILVTVVFSSSIWRALLGNIDPFTPAILAVGIGALAGMVQAVISGAMNGVNETELVAGSKVLAACVGLVGYSVPMIFWGINGALLGVGIGAMLQCVAVYALMHRRSGIKNHVMTGQWSGAEFKAILVFIPMMIVHSVADPLAMIVMREHILSNVSAHNTGILQASYRLAEVTMTVMTAGVSLYFMPRLGALTGNRLGLRNEIWRVMSYVMAIAIVLALAVFFLRETIVLVIFSADFIQVADLMSLQMVWLLLKCAVWICGFVLVSQMRQSSYIVTQLIGPAIFVAIVMQLEFPGVISRVVLASCVAAGIQLIFSFLAIRDLLLFSPTKPESR